MSGLVPGPAIERVTGCRWGVRLQAGALMGKKAQAKGGGEPTEPSAAGVGLIEGVVGMVYNFLLLQAIGGVVDGFFTSEV